MIDPGYRSQLVDRLVQLAKEDGLEPNSKKMYEKTAKYPIEELERVVDAFERFGAKNIFRSF